MNDKENIEVEIARQEAINAIEKPNNKQENMNNNLKKLKFLDIELKITMYILIIVVVIVAVMAVYFKIQTNEIEKENAARNKSNTTTYENSYSSGSKSSSSYSSSSTGNSSYSSENKGSSSYSSGSNSSSYTSDSEFGSSVSTSNVYFFYATGAAKQVITGKLKYPASSEFMKENAMKVYKKSDIYTVIGYVDAANGFNAKERKYFRVSMKINDYGNTYGYTVTATEMY